MIVPFPNTKSLLLNSSTPLSGSIFSPEISTSNYNNNLIINLIAGNTISLQLFGVLSIVNLVGVVQQVPL